MAWRSSASSVSCSTSATVTTKNMVVQQYQVHSPIYSTCFLLGYTFELFGFLFQLLGDTPQLSGDSSQLLCSCLDWLCSCLDRTPFWYSRSRVLDSTRSHSRWALWMFLSEAFTASLSFSFSSTRGSILFIIWRRCSTVQVIFCKCTMIMSKSKSQCQRGAFQMRY